MSLFISESKGTEIFISVWEWCPTWCQSCSHSLKKIKNYELKDVKKQIDIWNIYADDNFVYFLYWTDNIKNTKLSQIVKYIKKIGRKSRIQIPLKSKYSDILNYREDISEFVISIKVDDKNKLINLISSIKEFYNKNLIINYDLLIKKEYIKVIEKILNIKFNQNEDLTFSKNIWNIIINIRELYFINSKDKKIENLKINSCFAYESFILNKKNIIIKDHFEINNNLDIVFHNPLCFIGKNKISNLKQENIKIISDFEKYKNHYLKKLNSDFEKNCFKCITNWFNYNDYY